MQREQDETDVGLSTRIGVVRIAGLMMSWRSAAIAGNGSSTPAPLTPVADNASAIMKARFRNTNMAPAPQSRAGCPAYLSTVNAARESRNERCFPRRPATAS
jgi:hypothetical protein